MTLRQIMIEALTASIGDHETAEELADDVLAAIEASGYRLVPPVTLPNMNDAELPTLGPKQFEALTELAHYRDQGRRHCWRVASMKKLMAHGLVTNEPGSTQYWDITEAGRAALAARPRDVAPTEQSDG